MVWFFVTISILAYLLRGLQFLTLFFLHASFFKIDISVIQVSWSLLQRSSIFAAWQLSCVCVGGESRTRPREVRTTAYVQLDSCKQRTRKCTHAHACICMPAHHSHKSSTNKHQPTTCMSRAAHRCWTATHVSQLRMHMLACHFCGPVAQRPRPSSGMWPGGWGGPLVY